MPERERVEHVEVTQDPESREWRYRIIYANGRRGEGSEEAFEHLPYVLDERLAREHPDLPVHVTDADGGDYWVGQ